MKTYFNYAKNSANWKSPQKIKIRRFIDLLFEQEDKILKKINYIFCDDDFLLEINKKFLTHDYYTDIVTFDLSEDEKLIIGEVYISVDRIKENAKKFEVTTNEELLRVIIHGALHLCGYNDKTKSQRNIMRFKENEYLFLYKTGK